MVEWKKLIILGMGSYDIVPLAELVAPEDTEGAIIVVKSSRPVQVKIIGEGNIFDTFFGCREIVQCIWSQVTSADGHLCWNQDD